MNTTENTQVISFGAITKLAHELMTKHGLVQRGWRFEFDNAKSRVGLCDYRRKTIQMSRHWAKVIPLGEVKDTILHEIAHAIAGPHAGHGAGWRSVARSIGSSGSRCAELNGYKIDSVWHGVCPGCSKTIQAHRIPIRVRSCTDCGGGRFDHRFIFEWKKNGVKVPMHQKYTAELERIAQKYSQS